MVKIKRIRTADAVVAAFRFGKEEGTVGSLILGMYDDDGQLHIVGHTSGFTAKQKRELIDAARAAPHRRARLGRAEPLEVRGGARLGRAPSGAGRGDRLRPHHRQPNTPWREVHALARRQGSERVPYLAVAFLTLLLVVPAAPAAAQVQPDVYASGMRNPYRWSFDRQTATCRSATSAAPTRRSRSSPAAQIRARTSAGTASPAPPLSRAAPPPTTSRRPTTTRAART